MPGPKTVVNASPLGLGTMLEFRNYRASTKKERRRFILRKENVHATKKSCLIVRDKRSQ